MKLALDRSNDFSKVQVAVKGFYFVGIDVAVIMLEEKIKTSENVEGTTFDTEDEVDFYVDEDLVVCGFGFGHHYEDKIKPLKCTKLHAVPSAKCNYLAEFICAKSSEEANACSGDYGAPVYLVKNGSLKVVGLVSYYPAMQSNQACRRGHLVAITQLGLFKDLLMDPESLPTHPIFDKKSE